MNPEHLLDQAERLAREGVGRPRQADLRRAVSAAYYALFHLLTQEAARRLAAGEELRQLVARAYSHGEMKQLSRAFAQRNLPPALRPLLPVVPDDLRDVAQAFVDLQEARHQADYDLRTVSRFTRMSARASVQQARTAFDAWDRVRAHSAAEVYLLALLLHGRWGR